MKKQIATCVAFIILQGLFVVCFAQKKQQPGLPKWLSEKGYWIIESNIKTPQNSIVYFYTNENELMYKEKIEGIKINLKKRKVLLNLKKVLEQSIISWEEQHVLKEDEKLLATGLKK
jgi:hypothetical protein